MPTAKLTTRGQVTIPKEIRDRMGLRAGDELRFSLRDDGSAIVEPHTRDLRSLRGSVKPKDRQVSIEDMKDAVRSRGGEL